MRRGRIYQGLVEAVREGSLREPFSSKDFRRAIRGLAKGTYDVFLSKHRKGNPGGNTELFGQVGKGLFRLIRPTHNLRRGRVYQSILGAIRQGKLREPFTSRDFQRACRKFGEGTYNAFLWKHRKGNPGGNTDLVNKAGKGQFKLLRKPRHS